MKRILLILLVVVLVLGVVAAAGFTGYRFGYAQGSQTSATGHTPEVRRLDGIGPDRMPMHPFGNRFERGFDRGFGLGGFPMRGFGFFSPLRFLGQILVLGLIALFVYWLFTRSGWQLTRTQPVQTVQAPPPPAETETKE